MAAQPEKKPLGKVLGAIRDFAEDMTSLDVVTLTGSVEIEKRTGANAKPMELQEVYKKIQEKAFLKAEMDVVAFTQPPPPGRGRPRRGRGCPCIDTRTARVHRPPPSQSVGNRYRSGCRPRCSPARPSSRW